MPAAAQQRLSVSSVSPPFAVRSKADKAPVLFCWFFMPLSSGVR